MLPSTTQLSPWGPPGQGGQDPIEESVAAVLASEHFPGASDAWLQRRRAKWRTLLQHFARFGHNSVGNEVTLLEGGDACFPRMLAAIAEAKTRVWLESYIFDSSKVGRLFVEALVAAKQRGCDVILLVDYIGGFGLQVGWVEELRSMGADVVFFNPVLPTSPCSGPASFRDHRKILICDEVGFCGGANIQEEVGEECFGTSKFYEVHAELRGPCVADLADVLRDSLHESGTQVLRESIPRPAPRPNGIYVQILQSNVRQRRRSFQEVITQAIDAAEDAVFLTSPYFFPPGFLRRVLQRVPQRGVSLSLLLSGSSDFYPLPGDLLAQTHFLRRFFLNITGYEDRVAVHLYGRRHMHAKHLSIDGIFGTIGSFNFDLYSARRNLEVGISVFDHRFAATLQAMHQRKTQEAKRTMLADAQYQQPVVRVACAIAYYCVRLSGRNLFDGLDCFQRKWLVRKAALTYLLEEQAAPFVAMSMMWGLE